MERAGFVDHDTHAQGCSPRLDFWRSIHRVNDHREIEFRVVLPQQHQEGKAVGDKHLSFRIIFSPLMVLLLSRYRQAVPET